MEKKTKLANILISISCTVLGLWFLYNNYNFYTGAKIAEGVITKIDWARRCIGSKGCQFSQDVTYSFNDAENRVVTETKEISTITLVSMAATAGDRVKILYKPAQYRTTVFDGLVKNIGTPAYNTKFYTWHYWAYPILLILLGPLWYWAFKKLNK
ncbi:MAG: hypothetical protein HY918_03305 [Candidatus Doudnabacteria bacterium]|nr:hypothetical protein [Candidatus Doudnabacteria bacterium]